MRSCITTKIKLLLIATLIALNLLALHWYAERRYEQGLKGCRCWVE